MVVLISITLLVATATIMLVVRIIRPDFGYHWLIAAVGGFIAWGLVLGLGFMLPTSFELPAWGLGEISTNSVFLLADRISWPFAMAIMTILFAAIMTDVVRAIDIEWSNWAGSLLMASLGLIAVFAANLLTFVLIWTAVDIVGFVIIILQVNENEGRRNLVMSFFARLLGTSSLLLAGAISLSESIEPSIEPVSPSAIVFIVLAAALRLGALPGSPPILEKRVNRRSFGTVIRLISAGMVFLFLVRSDLGMAEVTYSAATWLIINGILIIMALFSGVSWVITKDEMAGRQVFLTAIGALVIASVLHSQPAAGMVWGLAGMFSGGLLFLASVRSKVSLWITLIGALGLVALPYSPTWSSLAFFSSPFLISMVFYFLVVVLLVWGFVRHAAMETPYPEGIERWIRVIYPAGLLLLPLMHFTLGLMMSPGLDMVPTTWWILGFLILILAVVGYSWQRRGGQIPVLIGRSVNIIISLDWVFAIIRSLVSTLGRLINFITNVLEGEGGFLWVLLWIVLFLAILVISSGT